MQFHSNMDTTAIKPNVLTTQEAQAIITQPTIGIPDWSVPPQSWDIIATMVLGVLAVWAKETWTHYSNKSTNSTDFTKMVRMIIPGIFAGLLGGEIATATGHEATTWLFALIIGFSGTPAIEMITNAVLAILEKLLKNLGAEFEKLPKNDTITTYENTHNNPTNSVHDLPNNSVGTIHRPPEPVLATPATEPAIVPVSTNVRGDVRRISDHFTFDDGFESSDGSVMPEQVKQNITALVNNGLEKIRIRYGKPIKVNSCYRSPLHNAKIGGSATSAHMYGLAVDISCGSKQDNDDLGALIIEMVKSGEIECDQLIFEDHVPPDGFSWIHYGYRKMYLSEKPRNMYMVTQGSRPFKYAQLTPELSAKYGIA